MIRRTTLCLALGSIALAEAAAQTSVTVYGTADGGFLSRQLAGESRVSRMDSGMMTTSRWGLRGTEDLGGGTTALFDLSSHIRIDTGEFGRHPGDVAASRYWSRLSMVGLRGGFGQVLAGRIATGSWVNALSMNAFGESAVFSPFLLHTFVGSQPMLSARGGSDGSWSNSLAYSTPTIGGFSGAVQWAPGEGGTDGRRLDLTANYRAGDFAAAFSHWNIGGAGYSLPRRPSDPAGAPYIIEREKGSLGSVSYDLKAVRVFGQIASAELSPRGIADVSLKTVSLSASVPTASGRVLAGWARTKREQGALAERTRNTFTVGYDHVLSRRTDLYVMGMRDSLTGLSRGTSVGIGVRHHF